MRRIRIAVCLIFLASCGIFGVYMFQTRMVEDHTPPVITCREDTISVSVEAQDEEILLEYYDLDYDAEKYRVVTYLDGLILSSEFRFENPETDLEKALEKTEE